MKKVVLVVVVLLVALMTLQTAVEAAELQIEAHHAIWFRNVGTGVAEVQIYILGAKDNVVYFPQTQQIALVPVEGEYCVTPVLYDPDNLPEWATNPRYAHALKLLVKKYGLAPLPKQI